MILKIVIITTVTGLLIGLFKKDLARLYDWIHPDHKEKTKQKV